MLTGSAGSAPMPFVPRFSNSSWFQNTTSSAAYTQLINLRFNGTWGVNDFAVFRVNALMFWGGTYGTSTWTSYGRTQGTLQIRPAGMPSGVWSNASAPSLNWANNSGSGAYAGITAEDISFYWADGGGGTITQFNVYGANKDFNFLFTDPGAVPYYAGMSVEYLYSFASSGGSVAISATNTYTSGSNNTLT